MDTTELSQIDAACGAVGKVHSCLISSFFPNWLNLDGQFYLATFSVSVVACLNDAVGGGHSSGGDGDDDGDDVER